MLQFKTVTSVSEAIDAFRQWQNFEDPIGGHLRYWFRGQAKSEWPSDHGSEGCVFESRRVQIKS
jgi:hypothetical protein